MKIQMSLLLLWKNGLFSKLDKCRRPSYEGLFFRNSQQAIHGAIVVVDKK